LSTTYRTVSGDTFNLVARKTTGKDTTASTIKSANPGIIEPFKIGTVIQIPDIIDLDSDLKPEGVDIKINNIPINVFDNFTISKSIDAIRRVYFEMPNEKETRDVISQGKYNDLIVGFNGDLMFTGFCIFAKPEGKILKINGFSKCSILENAPAPQSAFPLEFTNSTLGGIAKHLCELMGVGFSFSDDSGARFDRTDIEQTQVVLDYFAQLATQRNFIISDDVHGGVVFWRGIESGSPILTIDDTQSPSVTVDVKFEEPDYYSSVTGVLKTKTKKVGASFTVENPFFNGIVKPYNFEVKESSEGELKTAVETVAGRMFAKAFVVTMTIASWIDDNNDTIDVNKIVRLRSPDNYIEDYFDFLVKDVSQTVTGGSKSSTLNLVLPGVFSGKIPESVPWN
jgi:prophage tail gpP-like protein/phage tail protein X